MFLGSAVEQYLRDNLRSVLGRFSFLQMLSWLRITMQSNECYL
jgi:regulator of protease activity HflC (stomatin/prohibitin superfamily)